MPCFLLFLQLISILVHIFYSNLYFVILSWRWQKYLSKHVFKKCRVVSQNIDMSATLQIFWQSIKLRPLHIHNGGCFETLNLLHVRRCEMFTFCDVLHETNTKTANKLSRMRSTADWKSSLRINLEQCRWLLCRICPHCI